MFFEVEVFKVFVLTLVRISGFLIVAPVLGSRNFPMRTKIGFAALMAFLLTPTVVLAGGPLPDQPGPYILLVAGELAIGLMIGFVMTLFFSSIQVAGQIMDMQTGFGLVNVFNPALETQFPIFGFFFFLIAVLYLLATNGHLLMIRALAHSYDAIPLGGFALRPPLLLEVSTWGHAMFYDGLLLAAPIAGAMLLAYISMGLLGRVVPQIHLFVVGFPVTIALGLLLAALVMGVYVRTLDGLFRQMFQHVDTLIRGMS
jgi:flagellar biosynthetic protein FliR